MNKQIVKFILCSLLLISLLSACSKQPDDQVLLEQRIAELVAVIEARKAAEVQSMLAKDFRVANQAGAYNIQGLMHYHFSPNQVIKVFITNQQIKLSNDTVDKSADVTMDVFLTGSGSFIPERNRQYHVRSRWVKSEGEWFLGRLAWDSGE